MTESKPPDLNSRQLALGNPDLRHLFESGHSTSCSPVVCAASDRISSKKLILNDLGGGVAHGDSAPIEVPVADTNRSPSQPVPDRGADVADKCHVTTRVSDTQTIRFSDDAVVLLDAEDYERLGDERWYLLTTKQGKTYAVAHGECGALLYLHREALMPLPARAQVDHKNGNTLDCRRENLRVATPSQQRANSRKRRGSASPYKGVYVRGDRFLAKIKRVHLGTFRVETDAARAYDRAARAEFGEFARLNFPEDTA